MLGSDEEELIAEPDDSRASVKFKEREMRKEVSLTEWNSLADNYGTS